MSCGRRGPASGTLYLDRLDWEGAIDRFRAAQQRSRYAKDPAERIEASIIDTRLAAAREAQKRQQEEGRKRN